MKTILVIFMVCLASFSWALALEYSASWTNELNFLILKNIPYNLGSATYEKSDCSGYLYITAKRAGIPVNRTTAKDMATGGGGWLGKDVKTDDADHLDLSFWTWSGSARTYGHVGAFMVGPKSGLLEVTHASETRGVVLDKLKGKLLTDLVKVRRLILGDK
jgi:hypothetical protein